MKFPKRLRIAILPILELFHINSYRKDLIEVTGGYESPVLDFLSFALKFKYTARIPDDLQWGNEKSDGTWTGLIASVKNNETDIALSRITATTERSKVVDFSYPYDIDRALFATKAPVLLSRPASLNHPFSSSVWIALLITIILISLFLRLLLSEKCHFKYILLCVFSSLLLKPIKSKCNKLHERFLVAFWLVGISILCYSYEAVLLSFLTVPLKEKTIDTNLQLSNALDSNSIKCFIRSGSSFLEIMRSSTDVNIRNIVKHIEKNNWFIHTKETSEVLKEDNVAAIGNEFFIIKKKEIDLHFSTDVINYTFFSIAVNKRFCCKAALDDVIHRITAAVLYDKAIKDGLFRSGLTTRKNVKDSAINLSLTLPDLSGAFLALLGGYVLSFITLTLEVIYFKIKAKSQTVMC